MMKLETEKTFSSFLLFLLFWLVTFLGAGFLHRSDIVRGEMQRSCRESKRKNLQEIK